MEATKNAIKKQQLRPIRTEYDAAQFEVPLPPVWASSCQKRVYDQISVYRCADKSLAWPTSRCILFDGENISFDASLVIYINSTNIPPIMITNRLQDTQNLLSL